MTQPHRTRHFVSPARPRAARAIFSVPDLVRDPGVLRATEVLAAAAQLATVPALSDTPLAFLTAGSILAEDALYAAMGAVTVGQLEAARGTLAALLGSQRPDGRVPSALAPVGGWRALLARVLGRPDDALVVPDYAGGVLPTALVLWLGAVYAEATGDRQFLQDHRQAFESALAWLETQQIDGLPTADGAKPDLQSGVLTYRALRAMGEMAMLRGEAVEAARYWARAAAVRERVNVRFWEAGYTRFTEESAAGGRGNLLSAACGLAAGGQAQAILSAAEDGLGLSAGVGFHALAAAEQGEIWRARQALDRDHLEHRDTMTAAEAGRLLLAHATLANEARPRALAQ